MRSRSLAVLAVACLGSACVATPLGTARTLPEGAVRNEVALGATTVVTVPGDSGPESDETEQFLLVPMASWSMRTGLADGVELGLGAQTLGVHGDLKLSLLRTDSLALSFAPGFAANIGNLYSATAPFLLDLDLGRSATLVLEAAPTFAFGGPGLDYAWTLVGFGGGLAVWLSESFALEPGVHVLLPLNDGGLVRARPLVFGGMGFLFGPRADAT